MKRAFLTNNVVTDLRVPSESESGELVHDYVMIGWQKIGGVFVHPDGTPPTADERRREWHKSEFLERVDQYAPGAWDAFIAARDAGNPVAKQVFDRGWATYYKIVSDDPETLTMMGALKAIGIFTEEQIQNILEGL